MSNDDYRVTATADLSSTWIDTPAATHQATRRDVKISVKTGHFTGDDDLSLEMWATGDDKPHVLNLWKFEDVDEFIALADMMHERAEELKKDREVGLFDDS